MSQNAIKLSEWAKQKGLTYKGAWRMYRAGDLPCHSEQLPSGTILIYPDQLSKALGKDRVALYARVNPPQGEAELEQQMDRLRNFAAANGLCVDVEKSEIWNCVDSVPSKNVPVDLTLDENFELVNRPAIGLYQILEDPTIKTLIIENRDRFPLQLADGIEASMKAGGRTLLVVNKVVNKMSAQELQAHVIALCELYLGVEIPDKGDPDKYLLRYHLHLKGGSSTQTIDTRGEDMGQEGYNKMMAEHDAQAERVEKRLNSGAVPKKTKGHSPKGNPYVSHLEVEQQSDEQAERDEKIMEQKSDVEASIITKVVSHGMKMGIEQNVVDYTVRDQVDHDKHAKKIKEQKSDV